MSKNTVLIRYIIFTVFVFHAQKFDIDEEETEDQSIKSTGVRSSSARLNVLN